MLEPLQIREAETDELLELHEEIEGELMHGFREHVKISGTEQYTEIIDHVYGEP